MTQEEVDKMFNGRWRMKNYILGNIDGKAAKEIARDFFEAGYLLGEAGRIGVEAKITQEEAIENRLAIVYDNVIESGFEEWWSLYQKKVDRKKCFKKWQKLSPMEQYQCIHATPAYVASTPDPTFRKNPLTYLNGECWNDEIYLRNGTEKPTAEQRRYNKLTDILTD